MALFRLRRLMLASARRYGEFIAAFEASQLGQEFLKSYRLAYWKCRLCSLGEGSHIYPNVVIHCPEKVRIGKRVNIAEFVHIWGGGGVDIGDNVIIASHVVITSQTHNKYAKVFRDSKEISRVYVEPNCWIGAGAIILPGIRIGEGSIIGAQAVVTKDVAPGSMMVGVPAHPTESSGIEKHPEEI
jgi:maltose O-acetyltransferase